MENIDKVEAVQKMQDYIDKHLDCQITLLNLSAAANYSPYYCAKIFKELVGLAPFEYIRKIRLTSAAKKLKDDSPKVLDVALEFLFDSHEGFTRAFSKEFGISPYSYKSRRPPLQYFIPYSVLSYYLYKNSKKGDLKMEQTKTVFTQIVERPKRKAIIKRGVKAEDYFSFCEEVDCEVWGILESVKEALYEPVGFWLPQKLIKTGTSKYVQGVEVPFDYKGEIPKGFEIIELEPCKVMIFQGEPYDDNNFLTEVESVMNCIEKYNPSVYGYEWADDEAPRFQLIPLGYRGYIEARAVKEI